jgi:exodeoxyribonuclease VII small subunit
MQYAGVREHQSMQLPPATVTIVGHSAVAGPFSCKQRSGMSNKSEPETFEKSLGDLEQVVEEMEKGDLSLEASLALYERGIALSDQCQKRLNDAERKVRILSERDGEVQLEQYDEDDASE